MTKRVRNQSIEEAKGPEPKCQQLLYNNFQEKRSKLKIEENKLNKELKEAAEASQST